jgi:hypothetical protein
MPEMTNDEPIRVVTGLAAKVCERHYGAPYRANDEVLAAFIAEDPQRLSDFVGWAMRSATARDEPGPPPTT